MYKIKIAIILALCLAVVLAGCAPAAGLANTNWTLVELGGNPVLADTTVSLDITEDQIGGTDGCNQYGGPVSIGGDEFRVTAPLFSTLMACEQPIMEQADAYLTMLPNASNYRLEGDQLTLLDANGSTLAVFRAQ